MRLHHVIATMTLDVIIAFNANVTVVTPFQSRLSTKQRPGFSDGDKT
jgi:hypothetical protein